MNCDDILTSDNSGKHPPESIHFRSTDTTILNPTNNGVHPQKSIELKPDDSREHINTDLIIYDCETIFSHTWI